MNQKRIALVVIGVLAVLLVCLTGAYYQLQINYERVSEDVQGLMANNLRLLNETWTDNVGVDSNYVNYKAFLVNIGYNKVHNVTLFVSLYDQSSNLLVNEEIFVGEFDLLQYQDFDLNIEYSGEFSVGSTGYSYDLLF